MEIQISKMYPLSLCFRDFKNEDEKAFKAFYFDLCVTVQGRINSDSGLIINRDFMDKTIKNKIKKFETFYFHKKNDLFTKENFLKQIFDELKKTKLKDQLVSVTLKKPLDTSFEIYNFLD